MSHHENLAKQNSPSLTKGVNLRHRLKIVSGMSIKDVETAERAVHFGHNSQMSKFQLVAAENLRVETGLQVDVFISSKVLDLGKWREEKKIGEYYKSPDGGTFTYTEIVEERGSERVEASAGLIYIETVAFTSRSRAEVISSLGEPVKPPENNLIALSQSQRAA